MNVFIAGLCLLIGGVKFFQGDYDKANLFLLFACIGLLFHIVNKMDEKTH